MNLPEIKQCPSTLKDGYSTYSNLALKRVFQGRKVSPILPYDSPVSNLATDALFVVNRYLFLVYRKKIQFY